MLFCTAGSLHAQEQREQPTPFSVWMDFRALASATPPKIALPIWLASLGTERVVATETSPERTIFRLRFRRMGELNNSLQLRLFFDDVKNNALTVSGWSETGVARFDSGLLGSGLGLPNSENLTLQMAGIDYIDIATCRTRKTSRCTWPASITSTSPRTATAQTSAAFSSPR